MGPSFQFSVPLNPCEDRFLIQFLQQTQILRQIPDNAVTARGSRYPSFRFPDYNELAPPHLFSVSFLRMGA